MKTSPITVWTPEYESILRANYVSQGAQAVATQLGLTEHAVRAKARKLDVQRDRTNRWTEAENAYLIANYSTQTITQIAAALPGRSEVAISSRVRELQMKKKSRWTAEEDADLRRLYVAGNGGAALTAYFNRTVAAITRRASELGVRSPTGPKVWTPDRCEYLRLHYATLDNASIAKHLGLSVTSVFKKAAKMGLSKLSAVKVAAQLTTKRAQAKAKAQASAKPDYRAEKRPTCGQERKAGAAKAKVAVAPAKKFYHLPHSSQAYKDGLAAHLAGKQAHTITDEYGRQATIYKNRLS